MGVQVVPMVLPRTRHVLLRRIVADLVELSATGRFVVEHLVPRVHVVEPGHGNMNHDVPVVRHPIHGTATEEEILERVDKGLVPNTWRFERVRFGVVKAELMQSVHRQVGRSGSHRMRHHHHPVAAGRPTAEADRRRLQPPQRAESEVHVATSAASIITAAITEGSFSVRTRCPACTGLLLLRAFFRR